MARRQTQGRKKIEMTMITEENARRITFSKRRQGLFKKASELSTLCGVEITIILFSLGGKAYSFGSPNVDSIVDRFLKKNGSGVPAMSGQEANLNQQFHEINKRLDAEKRRNHDSASHSFKKYVNDLDLDQLEELKRAMVELKKNVVQRLDEMLSKGPSKRGQGEEEAEALNTGKDDDNDDDVSTIPRDWLKL